jgi:RecB family exonuclease
MALYETDDGAPVTTNSMIKSFRRCPKQAQYKYAERLKPRMETSAPLKRGVWMHELLEAYYKGEDWKAIHTHNTARYANLFDEEKEKLGDLPRECMTLMRSYLWHYGANADDPYHGWKIHEVELTLEAALPNGHVLRGRMDLLIEDEYGLWIEDHKTHKVLPDFNSRLLDSQSAIYLWLAWKNKIPVQGFIWNYLRTKPPAKPTLLKDGSRLSKVAVETDYPTYYRALKEYGLLGDERYAGKLQALKEQRWEHGKIQSSPFFQRHVLEKHPDMVKRVVREAMNTSERMHGYDFSDHNRVERVPDRSCRWMCSYNQLCEVELFDGNAASIRRQQFKVGDPLDYYGEPKEVTE